MRFPVVSGVAPTCGRPDTACCASPQSFFQKFPTIFPFLLLFPHAGCVSFYLGDEYNNPEVSDTPEPESEVPEPTSAAPTEAPTPPATLTPGPTPENSQTSSPTFAPATNTPFEATPSPDPTSEATVVPEESPTPTPTPPPATPACGDGACCRPEDLVGELSVTDKRGNPETSFEEYDLVYMSLVVSNTCAEILTLVSSDTCFGRIRILSDEGEQVEIYPGVCDPVETTWSMEPGATLTLEAIWETEHVDEGKDPYLFTVVGQWDPDGITLQPIAVYRD